MGRKRKDDPRTKQELEILSIEKEMDLLFDTYFDELDKDIREDIINQINRLECKIARIESKPIRGLGGIKEYSKHDNNSK